MYRLLVILLVSFSGLVMALDVPFFKDHARGHFWYEVNRPVVKKKVKSVKVADSRDYVSIVDGWRKEYLRLVNKAIVTGHPSDTGNVIAYQKFLIDKAQRFSGVWQIVLAQNPNLNDSFTHPTSSKGQKLVANELEERKLKVVKGLAKTHGLLFFYSSDCPHCHEMSPVVKSFSKRFGWDILAISMDGGSLAEFPEFVVDKGQARALEVKGTPALLAFNAETKEVLNLAYGFMVEEQIIDRALFLDEYLKRGKVHED